MVKKRVLVEDASGEMVKQTIEPVSQKLPSPAIPTGLVRHATHIRLGKISGEIFCKDPVRRQELGLPIIYPDFEISEDD